MQELNFEIKKKEYKIKGTGKSIFLDLGDLNFVERLEEARDKIYEKLEEQTKGIDPSKNLSEKDLILQYEQMRDDDRYIREQLDYAFDYPVSEAVFGAANVMTTDDEGISYYERFLDVMLPEVEKEYNVRMKKAQSRAAERYTSQKGKHSK